MSRKKQNKNNNTPIKVVGYTRFSSHNQNENSTRYQCESIQNYCEKNGYELVHIYSDSAKTGKNDNRDQFKKMMQEAQNSPSWKMIIVFSLSRFFRNADEIAYNNMLLKRNRIKLVSVTQDFDDTPEGRLMKSIMFGVDAFHSDSNAIYTHSAMKTKAEDCIHCGGIPPLGYDVGVDQKLKINKEEAKVVQMIFDMYEANVSYAKMAEFLNSRGHKTKVGTEFKKTSFISILKQEKYTGIYIWDKTEQRNEFGLRNSYLEKPIEEQTRKPGGCPKIISKEQFFRVQKMLEERACGKAESKSRNHYMLSGLKILKCAECGSYMIGTVTYSHGNRYTTYFCPEHKAGNCPTKAVRTEYVDDVIAQALAKDLYRRDDIHEISKFLRRNEDYRMWAQKLRGNEVSSKNIVKAISAGGNSEILMRELKLLAKEKQNIEREMTKCKMSVNEINDDNILDICHKLRKYLKESEDVEVKNYLRYIIDEILINNEKMSFTLNDF